MGSEHPPEKVFEAEELYVVSGLTYEQVATATDVGLRTLKRWGKKYAWREARDEYRETQLEIKKKRARLRLALVEHCLESLDSMDAFAVAKMERAAVEIDKLALVREKLSRDGLGAGPEINTQENQNLGEMEFASLPEALAGLDEALLRQLGRVVGGDQAVDLRGVQGVLKTLEAARLTKERLDAGEDENQRVVVNLHLDQEQ